MIDRARNSPDERELFIELGRVRVPSSEAARLAAGSVVSLDALVDEPVKIVVDGRVFAEGEVLELDGSFSIRVTKLIGPQA